MEPQTLLNAVLASASAVLGWFARTMYTAMEDLRKDHNAHKVHVAENYATNGDVAGINSKLDEVLRYLRK